MSVTWAKKDKKKPKGYCKTVLPSFFDKNKTFDGQDYDDTELCKEEVELEADEQKLKKAKSGRFGNLIKMLFKD